MDIRKTYLREDVEEKYTWDLSHIYRDEAKAQEDLELLELRVGDFLRSYKGKLNQAQVIDRALGDYREILKKIHLLMTYSNLKVQVDNTNRENMASFLDRAGKINRLTSDISFFKNELLKNSNPVLEEVMEINKENENYIRSLLEEKPYILSDQEETILSKLNMTFNSFERIYDTAKLQDMSFDDFEAQGKKHPLSYNIYEGMLENDQDLDLRRNSFRAFSQELEKYKNVTAQTYLAHCQMEKTLADLRGFPSVIDYLLFEQRIPRELYDRQIDLIMEELAPIMRRYAQLLKRVHGLDEIRYEDLKIDLDYSFDRLIEPEDAREILNEGLAVLGEDYLEMVNRAFDERWIDFVNNKGKSTGAFCASPYGAHPYILISWTGKMTEAMVLGHELGHAGHFYLNNQEQNILDTRPSTYFIEAPSTTNELIMAHSLVARAQDKRERRYFLSQIISRTYYHNFVTHLLEAAYQREVYRLIDQGKSFSSDDLSDIFLGVLRDFWGDSVVLSPGAELTWMRQPHYYMGLYPYTYSAGLTIGTEVSQKILEEGDRAVERWLATLKLGGTMDSIGLARQAGVDIRTEEPLRNTIAYIGSIVDELDSLSRDLGE